MSFNINPSDLGFPDKFKEFYPAQLSAFLDLMSSDCRFTIVRAPTGSGKTGINIGYAALSEGRAIVLVSNKTLQDQTARDFSDSLVDIRGHKNYKCAISGSGRDEDENVCQTNRNLCDYWKQIGLVNSSNLVLSNYSSWISIAKVGDPERFGKFDLLLLDEAHLAQGLVCDHLAIDLDLLQLRKDLLFNNDNSVEQSKEFTATVKNAPIKSAREHDCLDWCSILLSTVETRLAELELVPKQQINKALLSTMRRLVSVVSDLSRFVNSDDDEEFVVSNSTNMNFRLSPIWCNKVTEQYLFRGIKRVVLTSATIPQEMADYLGIPRESCDFIDVPSSFPPDRRPVYFIPSVPRMSHRTTDTELRIWANTMSSIVEQRNDRKGIVHSRSYDRNRRIYNSIRANIRYRVITHDQNSRQTLQAIQTYCNSTEPVILLSPSVEEGLDLANELCEYVIVTKVPFLDSRDPVTAIRLKEQPSYGDMMTAISVEQSVGRGFRNPKDSCEIFILDGNWGWFYKRAIKYFSPSFKAACKVVSQIPKPPQALTTVK